MLFLFFFITVLLYTHLTEQERILCYRILSTFLIPIFKCHMDIIFLIVFCKMFLQTKSSELSTLFRPFNLRDLRITLFNSSLEVCFCFIKVNISLEIITEGILDQFYASLVIGRKRSNLNVLCNKFASSVAASAIPLFVFVKSE